MQNKLFIFYLNIQKLKGEESGQDLIEYALIAALIAVAAIGGMSHIASAVNTLFSHISSSLA